MGLPRFVLLVGLGGGRGLWLSFVGAMGPFWLWVGGWMGVGVLVGCAQSRELGGRAARLLRFILLVSLSDTLLVVSMVDIVYDCHS